MRLRGQQQPRQILGAEARTHAPRAQLEQRLDVARFGPHLRHEPGAAKRVALEAAGDVLGAAAHERAPAQCAQVAALDLRAVRREIDPAGLQQLPADEQNGVLGVKRLHLDAGQRFLKPRDRQIHPPLVQQVLQRVVALLGQDHAHVRVHARKRLKDPRQDGPPARVGDAHAQLAALVFRDVAECALHLVARLVKALCVLQKHPPGVRQLQRRAPHHEWTAELTLERCDGRRERLLRDVQRIGRACVAALAREREKVIKGRKVHAAASGIYSFYL